MGYAFFDKSGVFNPADYGLNVGDTIQVVCVGGGGGGCSAISRSGSSITSYLYIASGGNGGTTSFGSHCTALGGGGGVAHSMPSTDVIQSTQGQFLGAMNINSSISSGSNYGYPTLGAGGAGGYIPGSLIWGGNAQVGINDRVTPSSAVTRTLIYITPNGTAGFSSYYSQTYYGFIPMVSYPYSSHYIQSAIANMYGSQGLCAGAGAGNNGGGGGGSGYGAGAGSASGGSGSLRGYSGNSGEVRRASIKLTNIEPIIVSVGGGGGGGGYHNGADGTSSGGGGCIYPNNPSWSGGQGGYGGVAGENGKYYTISNDTHFGGGGGAGGCIEVFW